MVLRLLELLKNGKPKRFARDVAVARTKGPVDFSELRTKIYRPDVPGLARLQFATRHGAEPIDLSQCRDRSQMLPRFELLEDMSDQRLKDLLKKLSAEKSCRCYPI